MADFVLIDGSTTIVRCSNCNKVMPISRKTIHKCTSTQSSNWLANRHLKSLRRTKGHGARCKAAVKKD